MVRTKTPLILFLFILLCSSISFAYNWVYPSTSGEGYGYSFMIDHTSGKMLVKFYESENSFKTNWGVSPDGLSGYMRLTLYNDNVPFVVDSGSLTYTCFKRSTTSYECTGTAEFTNDAFKCDAQNTSTYNTTDINSTYFNSVNGLGYSSSGLKILANSVLYAYVGGVPRTLYGLSSVSLSEPICLSGNCYDGSYYWFLNRDVACIECAEKDTTCSAFGYTKSDGNSFICDSNGRWVLDRACLNGGWVDCGLSSVDVCSKSAITLSVANTHNEPHRISMFDTSGRELQYSDGVYNLFANQKITVTAFEFLEKETANKWALVSTDQIGVNYAINSTEASCEYVKVMNGSFDEGSPFYTDISTLNCSLKPGYISSDISVMVMANLTVNGVDTLVSNTVNENFTVRLVADVALLDNFQLVYFNTTTLAITGHFIRLSDLAEIPISEQPSLNISVGFYKKVSTGVLVSSGNFKTATSSYSEDNYLYMPFNITGGIVAGDVFKFNATVSATGYANTSYSLESGVVADLRVLYFKCANNPKNTTYDFDVKSTKTVNLYCSYALSNVSAMSVANLANTSNITLTYNVNYNSLGDVYGGLLILVNDTVPPAGPYVGAFSAFDIPFINAIGNIVHNAKDVFYVRNLGYGGPAQIYAGRYVGRWAILNNPSFLTVWTYVDLVVEPTQYQYYSFGNVAFLAPSYDEGDDVTCRAQWYDPYGVITKWSTKISGDDGYEYTVSGKETVNIICPSNSTTGCIGVTSGCVGNYGNAMRLCTSTFTLYDAQSCLSKDGNASDSKCTAYKAQLFSSGGSKQIKCDVTLFKAEALGGSETKTATTNMVVTLKSFWDMSSWLPWWMWILLILALLIVIRLYIAYKR